VPRKRIDARALLAHHEAGHAVLSAAINDAPHRVSVVGDATTHGRTTQRMIALPSSLAQVYLAGFAAEHILTGRRPRQLDQEIGFSILARTDPELMKAFVGAEHRDGHRAVGEALRFVQARTDDEILEDINRLYDASPRESLGSVWSAVQRVAGALVEAETLSRDEMFAAIGRDDIYRPVFAVQARHGLLAPVAKTGARG
jgi:ATP-dependent Zn protease